jgi:polyhydroxyalkanoate synthase
MSKAVKTMSPPKKPSTSKKPSAKTKAAPKNDNAVADRKQQFPDPMELSKALMHAYKQSQPMFREMVERYNKEIPIPSLPALDNMAMDPTDSTIDLMKSMASDPLKYWSMQLNYAQKQVDLLQNSMKKFSGEDTTPVIEPRKGDRRFRAEEWNDSALFDFSKQYYLLASEHVQQTIDSAEDMPKAKKDELSFTAGLMIDALSPSNFLMTNPVVLNETIRTGGENLINGFENFSRDMERGKGELKISMSNDSAFKLGENIATTPGHVVFQNDLIQLIQFEPSGETVFKRPLLIAPPWINKYYILDLREDNSFIKWAVDQGHTVFCISWVNPDTELAAKGFDDYMHEGILASLDAIEEITGEPDCNAIGYCLGGTLLTTAMAYLKAKKQDKRIASATFFTTLIDFEHAGDLKLFMGDAQIEAMEKAMLNKGVFPAKEMQQTFSLLRANDMIWSFVINNYLMGKEPFPFDLLYWNDDATNMPAAMHSFYLKNMYRDNLLAQPKGFKISGVDIDVTKIETPSYLLSTREDHIAPWQATYRTTQLTKGPKTFTLAASGHIAGVISAPGTKYCYWSADETPADPDAWMDSAKEQAGSWWPHWQSWVKNHAGSTVKARKVKAPIEPAPGTYARMRS